MKKVLLLIVLLSSSSCLKTRSEIGENYQSEVYSKQQAQNQQDAAQGINQASSGAVSSDASFSQNEDKDDLIRQLNGRIEILETQLTQLQKEKSENKDAEKLKLLEESLTKMENQIHQLESVAALKGSETKANEAHSDEAKKNESETKGAIAPMAGSSDQKELNKHDGKVLKEATKDEKLKNQATVTFDKAQAFFANKDFKNAILEYQKFVDEKPKSNLIPESKYKMGLCFEALGFKDEAFSFYEEVAAQYSKTEFGKKAKAKVVAKANSSTNSKTKLKK